jgi:hypothetical protein
MEIADLLVMIERLQTRVGCLEGKVTKLEDKRPAPARGKKAMEAYTQEVVDLIRLLHGSWPKTRVDGSPIKNDSVEACSRLSHILETNKVNLEDIKESTLAWIDTKPPYANAIHFYFGNGKLGDPPPWERELRALLTKRAINEEEIDANQG